MAITSILLYDTSGSHTLTTRSYTHTWQVITDDNETTEYAILNAVSVSAREAHPNDASAFCTGKSASRKAVGMWLVQVNYETGVAPESDPVDRAPVYSWDSDPYEEYPVEDAAGNKYVNTADDPLENLPPQQYKYATLTVSRYEASFSADVIEDFVEHLNSGVFFGKPAYYARCTGISASQVKEEEDTIWLVNYHFSFKFDTSTTGWRYTKIQSMGYRKKVGDPAVLQNIMTEDEVPMAITAPAMLNATGTGVVPPGDDPHEIDFQRWPTANFATLGLE